MSNSLARGIARYNMKKAGLTRVCKKDSNRESFFSKHWREYVFKDGKALNAGETGKKKRKKIHSFLFRVFKRRQRKNLHNSRK